MNKEILRKTADTIRILSAAMVEKAGSGHPGGAMGAADYMSVLYANYLNFDVDDMTWPFRDRFFLDPGHMSPMLYSVLGLFGKYSMKEIENFRQWQSPTPGHPELEVERGIENTSGPLGQGHTNAVGAAIAAKFLRERFGDWMDHRIFAFISDGGIQEEISQGTGRLAGFLGLDNLIMFYDSNDIQLSSETQVVMNEDTKKKYEAWGWKVKQIDGHDYDQIIAAMDEAVAEKEKPFLIIGKTIMGKGTVDENGQPLKKLNDLHGKPIGKTDASFEKTIENLGGDPNNPFVIDQEITSYFNQLIKEKQAVVAEKKKAYEEWAQKHPSDAEKLKSYFDGKLPEIDYKAIAQKENTSTRAAGGAVLAEYFGKIENLIVMSADLSNSDKTDSFLNKTSSFKKGDFAGAFVQVGVSELTMAAVANGMALHGGVIPVCGTFFVFSDFMKPAVRLAALMELPVKYVWTHDAFRVGEDGPTHQPVEQEAQIRLLEKLKNHSGGNSMLVLRPADAHETTVAWRMAMENHKTPSALILSRQNIVDVPAKEGSSRYNDALASKNGAYVVKDSSGKPDIILVANGSEVSTCIDGAELLEKEKNLNVRIVSIPSEGLFRNQSKDYQNAILPDNVPIFGLTAGLPETLKGLVGPKGKVFGLESFGFSAPYKVLDEKLGYTGQNVYEQVISYLEEYKKM